MKKNVRTLSSLILVLVLFISFGMQVFSYSGLLDEYSGMCGYAGQFSVDSFDHDDGTFYVVHVNDDEYYPVPSSDPVTVRVKISAMKHILIGYFSQLSRTITDDVGVYHLDYPVSSGTYKMKFTVLDSKNKMIIFHGSVYDNN